MMVYPKDSTNFVWLLIFLNLVRMHAMLSHLYELLTFKGDIRVYAKMIIIPYSKH